MKRALTLTGAIMGLVGGAFSTIWSVIAIIGAISMMSSNSYYYGGTTGSLILSILFLAISLITLIFSAVSIPAWNKEAEIYKKKKGMIITSIVFNFLAMLINLIMLIAGSAGWIVIFMILGMLLAIASAVLLLVDICREGGEVSKQETTTQVNGTVASNDSKLAAAETFEKKLAKLNAMKEHGIITEEEYSEIKKSYVKEFLG